MNPAAAAGASVGVRAHRDAAPGRGGLLPEAVVVYSAFAGLGAATVSFGICSTLLTTATASPWALTGTIIAGLWGTALIGWAVRCLRHGAPAWPWVILRVAPVAVFLHLASVAHGIWWAGESARSLDGAALSAAALELILLACVGWLARQSRPDKRRPAAGPLLMATFAGAVAVAAIASPGLAATAAGQHAVPHGEHVNTTPKLNPPASHHH
ncbi:hypothetical protein NG819_14580 [Pseudarthrobacter sp. Fe7]|nr:hypothetical protein NG819_14580 [Pseudarthrobacter sp. Fe7]